MSVVAGCLLFDGVLLAADSRVTFPRPSFSDVHVDYAQKLFAVAPGTALGYVGSITVASLLLRELFAQISQRRRVDPISLALWMTRFFRATYSRTFHIHGGAAVAFMIASSLHDRHTIVAREDVAAIVRRITSGHSPFQRNWMPGILVKILQTPPTTQLVEIPGTTRGILYTMESPSFVPVPCRPLHFAAIGSGSGALTTVSRNHDMIVAGQPGNTSMESMFLAEAIQEFIRDNGITSVGGLYQIVKVRGRQVEFIGLQSQYPVGGTQIELIMRNERLIQRNATTGREMQLLYPWEIPFNETHSRVFDDLEEAYRRFVSPAPASA